MTERTSAPLTGVQIQTTQQDAAAIGRAGAQVIRSWQFLFANGLSSSFLAAQTALLQSLGLPLDDVPFACLHKGRLQ